jgi:hypothetical protein
VSNEELKKELRKLIVGDWEQDLEKKINNAVFSLSLKQYVYYIIWSIWDKNKIYKFIEMIIMGADKDKAFDYAKSK